MCGTSLQNGYVLSPDGKTIAQLDVRELDHKLVLNIFDIADKKLTYRNIDERASDPIGFSSDGKGIVYNVRQHGVDNLWPSLWMAPPFVR